MPLPDVKITTGINRPIRESSSEGGVMGGRERGEDFMLAQTRGDHER
jgi:hypothetical protein